MIAAFFAACLEARSATWRWPATLPAVSIWLMVFLPTIGQFLAGSTFAERFLAKGNMRAVLERIPIRLVEHGQLGVLGAANWYLQHHTHLA